MTLIVAELRKDSKNWVKGKKEPYTLLVRDRLFYVVSDDSSKSIDLQNNVSHSDIECIYMIKMKKSGATMDKVSVDDYLKTVAA